MVTSLEISEYDIEELETQLAETRRELFNLRFQMATGRLDNFSRLSHVRKDVARMMTELRAREIAEAEGLAEEEIPAHLAAARLRSEDEALGRTRTTASERRAAARAEAAEAGEDEELGDDEELDDELDDEVEGEAEEADQIDAEIELQLQEELEDADDDQALARVEESDDETDDVDDDATAKRPASDPKKEA
jgi:large subunit ribosomal protein L29